MISDTNITFERDDLSLLKIKALRSGAWLKILTRLDRLLIDLTIKVTKRVQSLQLAKALLRIAKKVEDAFKGKVSYAMFTVGFSLTRKLGLIAVKWGNPNAKYWLSDVNFARFLTIMYMNTSYGGVDCL